MNNYGKLYKEHTAILKHREWRGFKDTMYDYYRWLVNWKDMIVMVLKAPVSTVKGIWRYRWMASYLSAPSFVDRQYTASASGQLRTRVQAFVESLEIKKIQKERQLKENG